jgi:hypothetical protein
MKMSKYLILFLSIVSVFSLSNLFATTTCDVFKRHKNEIFIESGSHIGNGIQNAILAGFNEIHSIEISPKHYEYCKKRFNGNSNVHLYLGNSVDVLPRILENINRPATVWLDGHYSWGDTGKGDTNTPILEELAIIATHPIKTHTILIDDVRQFGTFEFDFIELHDIVDLLMLINPNYQIHYEPGHIENDVLVAEE